MSGSPDIKALMKRTRRYWYEDGLTDVALGAYFLAIALFFWAQSVTPLGSSVWLIWGLGGPVLLIGGGLLVDWLVKRLKDELTHPRTGYVSYQQQSPGRRAAQGVRALAVAALIGAAFVAVSKQWLDQTILFGLVALGTFGYVSYRVGLRRYLLLGVWGLLFGLFLSLATLAVTMEERLAIYWIGLALGMLASGLIVWYRYNRTAPSPQEAGDESNA